MGRIANISANRTCRRLLAVAALMLAPVAMADLPTADVRHRGLPVVTFSAWIADGHLVVKADLADGWHIYAMDNVDRARARTGKEKPECELPTRFSVEGPVRVAGAWRQSEPADLSDPAIFWYTWGFEDEAVFAVPIEIEDSGPLTIAINGQACNASSCSMIQDVSLIVDQSVRAAGVDYDSLTALTEVNAE